MIHCTICILGKEPEKRKASAKGYAVVFLPSSLVDPLRHTNTHKLVVNSFVPNSELHIELVADRLEYENVNGKERVGNVLIGNWERMNIVDFDATKEKAKTLSIPPICTK